MVYCIDLNLLINVKTIVPWFQVTPTQTKPKLVLIIGNLGLAKRGRGWGCWVLQCAVKNEFFYWGTSGRSWPSYKFSPELRVVLSVLLDLFLLQVPNHTFIAVQSSYQLRWQASWELVINCGNIPGKDEDEMMNKWISYIWTAEFKKTNEENMIIAVKDATLRKESLKNLGFAGIWLELVIFC